MACRIPISILDVEKTEKIRSKLCMYPQVVKRKSYGQTTEPEPIIFYRHGTDYIDVPYLFGASLTQTIPNNDYPFSKIYSTFTGKLRETQISVYDQALEQLHNIGTSTLALPPGWGKTILGAKLMIAMGLMGLVLVTRETLTMQWKKTFEDNTTARVWIVGEKKPPSVCDVIICMDGRWEYMPPEFRRQIGFMIIDEAHCFCTPTRVGCLLAFHPKYILIESGSLERDDEMHTMMYALAGSHGVYRESKNPFKVMKILTHTKPETRIRFGQTDYAFLMKNTLFDVRRNQIILDLVMMNTKFKILILTASVDHAILLNDEILKRGVRSDCLCGTKKGYQDATVLVGTISKIGTGFDPANFCPTYDGRPFDLLILASSIQKYSMLTQNVGRVFRCPNPVVMHLVDDNPTFKNHWYKARKWYQSRNGEISEHHIQNDANPAPVDKTPEDVASSWIQKKILQIRKSK